MRGWVLATRHREELAGLADALAVHGLGVVAYPVLREVAADDEVGWRRVRHRVDDIVALFVTSPRAPRHFAGQARRRRLWSHLGSLPAAAVGAATALACRQNKIQVRHVGPDGGVALAESLAPDLRPGEAVLHPTSRHRREEAYPMLAAAGAEVLSLVVYDIEESDGESLPVLPEGLPAAVILTSPRAAAAYRRAVPPRLLGAPHFALGSTTADAAARLGLAPRILPRPDPLLLVEELCQT